MRRRIAMATLALVTALPALAQRGGMGARGFGRGAGFSRGFTGPHFAGPPAFARPQFRGVPAFGRRPRFIVNFRGGFRPGFRRPFCSPFFDCRFRRRFFVPPLIFAPAPLAYGYAYPPVYEQPAYAAPAPPVVVPDYTRERELEEQVADLSAQVDSLRAQQQSQAAAIQPPAAQEAPPATAFVFRDQHVEEAQNYAIVGKTLWILSARSARKIPLSQLDLAATARLNQQRGVEFVPPKNF